MIEAADARLLYLPPYSTDLNSIEAMWSRVKSTLRSARRIYALHDAFGATMAAVTLADILGCLHHFGRATT
jgi:transposase